MWSEDREISLHRCLVCFRCRKTTVRQVLWPCRQKFHFMNVWLVSDVKRPLYVTCMQLWRQKILTLSLFGLFRIGKDLSSVVCSLEDRDISLYQCSACFRCRKTTLCQLYAALQTGTFYVISTRLVSDAERPLYVSCMQPWRQGRSTLSMLGLFEMQKDHSMSVVCSLEDRDIPLYRCWDCFRCGKTTVCQLYAAMKAKKLHSVNCHLHTESADFLGGLRPVRSHSHVRPVCYFVCWCIYVWFYWI